jgi:hypothetical protein
MADSPIFLTGGHYECNEPCPKCGKRVWTCHPGRFPQCLGCGSLVLRWGKAPDAPCVTFSGHIDGHMKYAKHLPDGRWQCSFCGVAEPTNKETR